MTMAGTVTTYPLPQNVSAGALVRGPKSALWFAEGGQYLGSITTDGTITTYRIPIPNEVATSLTIGPDRNIWFSEQQPDGQQQMVGRMKPGGHFLSPFPTSGGTSMTMGPDDRVWIPQADESINALTVSGQNTNYCCTQEPVVDIVAGPDGNVWFVEHDYIGNITPSGVITQYSEPTSLGLASLAVGPDKRLWFTSGNSSYLGRVSLSGKTQFFENPINPEGEEGTIVAGPDNNLWFAEYNYIGVYIRFVLTVEPRSISFSGTGQTQTITVSEKHYRGGWTAISLNPAVATVAPSSPTTFIVTAVGSGSTSIDVADSTHNDSLVRVSVP